MASGTWGTKYSMIFLCKMTNLLNLEIVSVVGNEGFNTTFITGNS